MYNLIISQRNVNNQGKIVISSMTFSIAWLTVSFAFPLMSVRYSLSYAETGIIGLVSNMSFAIAAVSFLRAGRSWIGKAIRYVPFLSAIVTLFFMFSTKGYFAFFVGIVSIVQAFFWISIEIYLGYASGRANAEKYTASWDLPMVFAPILAGALIQYIDFKIVFVLGAIFFIIAGLLAPSTDEYIRKDGSRAPSVLIILPLIFNGITIGFFFYVLVPFLRIHGYSYIFIASIETVFAVVQALLFVLLNFVSSIKLQVYTIASALMAASPLILVISYSIYSIIVIILLSGIGSAIAFSKILAYISSTASPNLGVFYYETFYAVGFGIGSSVGGYLFDFDRYFVFLLFLPTVIYSITMAAVFRSIQAGALPY